MKRIHIIGRKDSGKTTLIVELVKRLTSMGYRVGTVKHTHHRHELDTPGKDSFRHRQAGAAAVGILSPGMTAVFWPSDSDRSDQYDRLSTLLADCDLVVVEGDSGTDADKIEVWRAATSTKPLATDDPSILAVVTDDSVEVPVPIWQRSDVAGLAARLIELAGGRTA